MPSKADSLRLRGAAPAARAKSPAKSPVDLAAIGRVREENALFRMVMVALGGVLATWISGSWVPVAWFAAALGVLIIERRVAHSISAIAHNGEELNYQPLILWTAFQSAVAGGLGPVLWFCEPRHGDAIALLWLAAGATNAIGTLRSSTPLMLAGLAPTLLMMIGLPLVDVVLRRHGAPSVEIGVALGCALLALNGFFMWRNLRRGDQAVEDAAESARESLRAVKDAASARAEFIGVMGREVRTPMAALRSAADLLRRVDLTPEARMHVDTLLDSSEVLAAVLDDLVDLDSIASGRVRIEPRAADPRALVRNVVAAFRAEAEEKGLELFLDVADDVPARVMIDPVRVRQVLFNLVSNAVKFTQSGGVRVRLQAQYGSRPGAVRLGFSVADTGVGMSRAELAMAMGDRRNLSADQKGLGLAISAKLARLMHAKLAAKSAPEQGSLFSLVLEANVLEQQEAPIASAPSLSILVVEDRGAERRVLAAILDAASADVEMAENAARAIDRLAERQFDLVIVDQRLPDMDAFDIAALLREGGPNAGTPVIALLEHVDQAMRAECEVHGVEGCVPVPPTPTALLDEIARVLGAPAPAASWAA